MATLAGVEAGIVAQALVSSADNRIEVRRLPPDLGDMEAKGLSVALGVMSADLELTVLYGHMTALI